MAEIKLTKNELRAQQTKLSQLQRYLPTLQLKKALLQIEVAQAKGQLEKLEEKYNEKIRHVEEFSALLAKEISCDILSFVKIKNITRRYENIAGCDVPFYEEASFEPVTYDLFDTPIWLELAIDGLREVNKTRAEMIVVKEKTHILEKELKEVTIRVNLFEKILIPTAKQNIQKIRIFLGDAERASIVTAKIAKKKRLQQRDAELARL